MSELGGAANGHGDGSVPLIAVLDTGVKSSIVRKLTERGARVRLHPCTSCAQDLLDGDPDAVLLGNGPATRPPWTTWCRP